MSMNCVVLTNRHLADTDAWQCSLDACSFTLKLNPGKNRTIGELSGHLPATWREQVAGFECSAGGEDDVGELTETYDDLDFGGPWSCTLDIYYWEYAGTAGAMMAAAAYAKATGGIVFECEGGDILDADAAIAFARRCEEDMWQAIQSEGG